jgi:hypothetical protein
MQIENRASAVFFFELRPRLLKAFRYDGNVLAGGTRLRCSNQRHINTFLGLHQNTHKYGISNAPLLRRRKRTSLYTTRQHSHFA